MTIAFYERLCQEDLDAGTSITSKRNPGGGTLTATQIGIHTLAVGQARATATWDPGEVAAGAATSTTITVSGAALGDFALASFSLSLAGLTLSAYVSATNTVTVVLSNLTAAAVDLSSGTLAAIVFKSR